MTAFEPLPNPVRLPELEEQVLEFWKRERIFQRGMELRGDARPYVFYEGPPTANGLPGVHHVLARSFKDCFLRYHQMLGERVERRGGWDTHGLPVELQVERSLHIRSKQEIEELGVGEFNRLCRASVMEYIDEWERLTQRVGFWLDMTHAYRTYDTEYMESVWWSLKQIYLKGWLYRGFRVGPYCPRCQTSLSSHELGQPDVYRDNTPDPGITVRFRLLQDPKTSLLAWTTTPWTMPGNVALVVGPDITYVRARQGDQRVILAKRRLEMLVGDYEIEEEFPGSSLLGLRYHRLFSYLPDQGAAWQVLPGDFVSTDEGTGVVHTAGAYGEDDLRVCQENGIEVRHTVGLDGRFLPFVSEFAGLFFKEADQAVIRELESRDLLYRHEQILHTYPFCWRCETPLIYYALDSWFIRTTARKEELLETNRGVRWVPAHLRDGRMGNWLTSMQDWNLSRARFWGTPLPIWTCPGCGTERCVGSLEELGLPPGTDIHRPYIDEVTIACGCGSAMLRVPEVIDCWYDSGAMPYAQWHYPFENQDRFAEQHPADFISEAVDQTRGWFYTLLAESVLLFEQPAYRNVVVPNLVMDAQGRKMSTSRGNSVDPWELLSELGADALRWWFYTTVAVGQEYRISKQRVSESAGRFLQLLFNTQSFFVTYANLADWSPEAAAGVSSDPLDRWILARLEETVVEVSRQMEGYDAHTACRAIADLIGDTSTWYLRCSRPRFRTDAPGREQAFATFHRLLLDLARLMAPFTPFVADALFRQLAAPLPGTAASVHLDRYPESHPELLDSRLLEQMAQLRRLAEQGRFQREQRGIPNRQPLAGARVRGLDLPSELLAVLAAELNLRGVSSEPGGEGQPELELDFELTPELRREGLLRALIRQIQALRRTQGLSPGEVVELLLATDSGAMGEAVRVGSAQLQAQCSLNSLQVVEYSVPPPPGFGEWSELKLSEARCRASIRRSPG